MCFWNDYDWYAHIEDIQRGPATEDTKCMECNAAIPAGEFRTHIYQQEHADCQICADDLSADYDDEQDPETCNHQYGEIYKYDRCEKCDKVLGVIEQMETEEGCPPDTRQPALEGLWEELSLMGDGADGYARRACKEHPELIPHFESHWHRFEYPETVAGWLENSD